MERAIKKTIKELKIKQFKIVKSKSKGEIFRAFINDESFLVDASTGFWPLDPEGDLQMLFTPNLHKPLEDITSDTGLQEKLDLLEKAPQSDKNQRFKEVNLYTFNKALFNVFTHIRYFYITQKNAKSHNLPLSIKDLSGTPWQVFKVEAKK